MRKIARVFQAPVITEVEAKKNTLRTTIEGFNIPLLVYKAGEAFRFDHSAIKIGVDGTKNVMRTIDMLDGDILKTASSIFFKR